MTYRMIESLTVEDGTTVLNGRTVPAPCLVEDDDGVRALLLPDGQDALLVGVWVRAHASGAALIHSRHHGRQAVSGEAWWHTTRVEEFMAGRREDARAGTLQVLRWEAAYPDPDPIGFREYMEQQGAPRQEIAVEAAHSSVRYVSLHAHSEFSRLDGLSTVQELVAAAVADGQPALALTDHGMVSGHPDLQKECEKAGINPIFGLEAYFVPDRHRRGRSWVEVVERKEVQRSDAREAQAEYRHMCLWAMDDVGLRNLWAASTESHRTGFYAKPRLDWEVLERYSEGVAASTGCLGGLVPQLLLAGEELAARAALGRLMELYPDRLYVELHANHLPEQQVVNKMLVELAAEYRLPTIAVSDSHYTQREQTELHRIWLALQTNSDLSEDTGMFGGGQSYHHHTADEVLLALAYLGEDVAVEAVANTVALAGRCTARLPRDTTRPVYSRGEDAVTRDVERLIAMCLADWGRKIPPGADQDAYIARFEREMGLFISRELCGFMLITADVVRWAKGQGVLVGPGRGSGGASLVAYLSSITELDPISYDLPFERFLTEEREEMPDFDIDFPESKRAMVEEYLRERWGADCVVRIANHIRLRPLQALKDAIRVLRPTLPYEIEWSDITAVEDIIREYAAGLSGAVVQWAELWEHHGDELDPYRRKYPEVFELVGGVVDRLKTYGKHPSGLLISTTGPLTNLPLWRAGGKDGEMVTQFDFRQVDELGYMKYDVLGLTELDTLQTAVDLIQARTSRRIDFYSWRGEYEDPQVWEDLAAGYTRGIFQIKTPAGTKMTKRVRPASVLDLAAIGALNRPGPKRSGLDEMYLRRRSGEEETVFADRRLEGPLGETYGVIIYQEQVMWVAQVLAGYGPGEADTKVRKVIAKKLGAEKMAMVGTEFIRRAIEHGTDRAVAERLWAGMAEFARYSFGKAHSVGYAVIAYWGAWVKTHFPPEFFACALSTADADEVAGFVTEARRLGYQVLPPDVNESDLGFTPAGTVIRYGLAAIKGLTSASARRLIAARPYTSLEDLERRVVAPKGSKITLAHLKALAAVGALDSIYPNRRALEMELERRSAGEDRLCVSHDPAAEGPGGLPCRFDWAHEPDPPMESRGRGAAKVSFPKPPPARCTIGCRRYTRRPGVDPAAVEPYTDEQIRERERSLLGTWLSSTPFDAIPEEDRALVACASDVEAGPVGAEYVVAALVQQVKPRDDRNGDRYAWLTLYAQDGDLDVACWAKTYRTYRGNLVEGALVMTVLAKRERGLELAGLAPL